jgi:hypothetical protein
MRGAGQDNLPYKRSNSRASADSCGSGLCRPCTVRCPGPGWPIAPVLTDLRRSTRAGRDPGRAGFVKKPVEEEELLDELRTLPPPTGGSAYLRPGCRGSCAGTDGRASLRRNGRCLTETADHFRVESAGVGFPA